MQSAFNFGETMRGKTIKKLNNWCRVVWERTPIEQRTEFHNYDHFVTRIKSQWNNVEFQKYIKMTIEKGLV